MGGGWGINIGGRFFKIEKPRVIQATVWACVALTVCLQVTPRSLFLVMIWRAYSSPSHTFRLVHNNVVGPPAADGVGMLQIGFLHKEHARTRKKTIPDGKEFFFTSFLGNRELLLQPRYHSQKTCIWRAQIDPGRTDHAIAEQTSVECVSVSLIEFQLPWLNQGFSDAS